MTGSNLPAPGSGKPPGVRRYGEKEVARLLRRAAELQRDPSAPSSVEGFTLAELEEVAAEAGIDPAHLRRAAAELERGPSSDLATRFLGAPVAYVVERVLPGELTREGLEELIPLISSATAGQGNATVVGRTLTWSSRGEGSASTQQVLITSRAGSTTVRIEERVGGLAGGLFGGLMGGLGGGLGLGVGVGVGAAIGSALLAVAFPAVAIGGSYALARGIFKAQVRGRRRWMHGLVERVAERVTEIGGASGALPGGTTGADADPDATSGTPPPDPAAPGSW